MGPPYEIQTFDRVKLLGRRWYFRIVDTGNWETVAQSEGYSTPYDRNETASDLSKALGAPIIPERRKRDRAPPFPPTFMSDKDRP